MKKKTIEYVITNDNYVFSLFNDNHKSYINLLKNLILNMIKLI